MQNLNLKTGSAGGWLVIALMLFAALAIAQPTFEVLPVSGDTTFQVQTTVTNPDDSETVRLTAPLDSTQIRNFLDTQIRRNNRLTARKVNELSDLERESGRLKSLYRDWNPRTYNQDTKEEFAQQFYGTWRMIFNKEKTLIAIDDKLQMNEIGGLKIGKLKILGREIILIENYLGIGKEVKAYLDGETYVFKFEDQKGFLRKVSDEIKKEEKPGKR